MEIIFSVVLVGILVGLFIVTFGFGGMEISTDSIGPQGFPQAIIIISLVLMAFVIWGNIRDRNKAGEKMTRKGFRIMAMNVVLLGVYLLLLNFIGFILATLVFGLAAIWNMGYRPFYKSLIFVVVLTAAVTLIFGKVFYVSLPRGVSVFREVSYFIY